MAQAAFDPDKYLAEKTQKVAKSSGRFSDTVMEAVPGTDSGFDPDAYLKEKTSSSWLDKSLPFNTTPRGLIQGGLDALPTAGMVAGGVIGTPADVITGPAGTVVGAGLGGAAGTALKNMGEHFILGKDKTREDLYLDPVKGGVDAASAEMGGAILGKGISKAAGKLSKFAEKSAVNATGATGKQASEFADDAGRQLLDRKIVRFGDSQAKISSRAAKAVEQVEGQIDSALKNLDAKGVKVDRNDIYNKVREKITSLKGDESQADIVNLLEKELENVVAAADAGGTKINISQAEKIKRGYNRKASNWADPEKGQAGKEMYQTFRRGVEGAAEAADPEAARLFEEAKKSYGLLAPIEEAAARRAATTQQSPPGGLLDISAAAAGALASGPAGAVAVPVARRIISPRMSSTAAVGSDIVAKVFRGATGQKGLLSGLIREGLLPKGSTEKDIPEGLMNLEQISQGYEQ